MSKDLQATIAGVVAALAVIAQWIATKLGVDLGITADFLGAVTVIGGLFVAWLVGKSGNTPEGTLTKIKMLLIGVLIFGFAGTASAQWKDGNAITVGWDAAVGATSYKIYAKPEAGGPETFMIKVDGATQGTATFVTEGRWLIGVSSVKLVGGTEVESTTKCWSNDNTCTFQGIAFGLSYIVPPQAPKNLRSVN